MARDEALWRLPATELARRYREGSLTPLAVAQACLARLEAVNPKINAVVARRDAPFMDEAEAATERFARGEPLSPLDGIPLSVKDSLYTRDAPTTWGCPALRAHAMGQDELAVARARAAGALIVGKTNVPEFALEGYTGNPVFGVTRNPWQLDLTPGGSSGGAVASVAAGITPLAIGQDGGGSIRRPASHTGLVGLKPTLSAVPREHVLPSLLLDFEVIGPLARTVADARMLFEVMRGPAPVDRSSLAAAQAAAVPRPARALRILYVERFGAAPLDPQIAASLRQAAQRLAQLGHEVREGALPLDLDFYAGAWPQIGQAGLAHLFDQHPDWAQQASPKYLGMAEQGRAIPAARLWQILEEVKRLRRDSVELFASVDAIVLPSAAALPWKAEDAYPTRIDGQEVGPRGHAVYTGWVNAAGLPALALPCEPSREGLPIGLQVVGPYGADDMLLDLGEAYESAYPWSERWPAL
ncbi:amidase [Ramlibacter alkalitolerans]|uniref:Amidase n=1 Tax=Ramlibacter alkalitolerans TaxID=2039631 RepID=A0ABS1JPV2_9BURK|nr:amidase [Ramlibacter alkalitolerans]MBL0425565.1 amidase [Ramlibacter alkalitolerans]